MTICPTISPSYPQKKKNYLAIVILIPASSSLLHLRSQATGLIFASSTSLTTPLEATTYLSPVPLLSSRLHRGIELLAAEAREMLDLRAAGPARLVANRSERLPCSCPHLSASVPAPMPCVGRSRASSETAAPQSSQRCAPFLWLSRTSAPAAPLLLVLDDRCPRLGYTTPSDGAAPPGEPRASPLVMLRPRLLHRRSRCFPHRQAPPRATLHRPSSLLLNHHAPPCSALSSSSLCGAAVPLFCIFSQHV
jgi:hypothetical protein